MITNSFTKAVVVLTFISAGLSVAAQERREFQPLDAQPIINSPKTALERTRVPTDFVIGAEDVLAINVWKEPDLSRDVPVRSDGKITLPLIGDVMASGKTTEQLQAELKKDLQNYIDTPTVTVMVREIRSRAFNVLGLVARPGAYPLAKRTTVLDAIALAGGFREWAKVKNIYVLRRHENGLTERLPFNYKAAIKGSGTDFDLQSRDTIVVP
jgi:polysaccharide export outer membrane protein